MRSWNCLVIMGFSLSSATWRDVAKRPKTDLKSVSLRGVGVRIPQRAPHILIHCAAWRRRRLWCGIRGACGQCSRRAARAPGNTARGAGRLRTGWALQGRCFQGTRNVIRRRQGRLPFPTGGRYPDAPLPWRPPAAISFPWPFRRQIRGIPGARWPACIVTRPARRPVTLSFAFES